MILGGGRCYFNFDEFVVGDNNNAEVDNIYNSLYMIKLEVLQFPCSITALATLLLIIIIAILGSDFDPNFSIQHQQKDLRLAIDMGDLYDQSFPVAAAANEVSTRAICILKNNSKIN